MVVNSLLYHLVKNHCLSLARPALSEEAEGEKVFATSDDELLDYLADLQRRLGRQPTTNNIDRDDEFSSRIFERFGSFSDAIDQLRDQECAGQFFAGSDEKGTVTEYIVVGESLYRGFNAHFLPVDRGVDIVALKGGKIFNIQRSDCAIATNELGNKRNFSPTKPFVVFQIRCWA